MNRTVRLTLENDIWYERSDSPLEEMLSSISDKNAGYDAFIEYSFEIEDESVEFKRLKGGEYIGPPSSRIREKSEFTSPVSIDRGIYSFTQIELVSPSIRLKPMLLPFIKDFERGRAIVRLYKENSLCSIMQFMIPPSIE